MWSIEFQGLGFRILGFKAQNLGKPDAFRNLMDSTGLLAQSYGPVHAAVPVLQKPESILGKP